MDLAIPHILPDRAIEHRAETERRLLARADTPLFASPAPDPEALRREYDRWWDAGG